jgi:hypothetical protein
MEGSITSFATTTLVVDVNVIGGSGTIASWNIVSAGLKGDTGASGATGATGPNSITTATTTNLTGAIVGNGSNINSVSYTDANTASTIVARDSSKRFKISRITFGDHGDDSPYIESTSPSVLSFGTFNEGAPLTIDILNGEFVGYLSGTANTSNNIYLSSSSTSSAFKVPFINTTGNTSNFYNLLLDSGAGEFTYNPSTNILTAGRFNGALADINGNTVIQPVATTSGVNSLTVKNSATGSPVIISTEGLDTNIGLTINTKGTGNIILDTGTSTGDIELKPGTSNLRLYDDNSSHYHRFVTGDNAANYDITLPSISGTLALLQGTQTFTGTKTFTSSAVKVGNTTLVQGGSVNITFPTLAGTLYATGNTDVALADGGTNASLTAVAGAVVYSTATAMALTGSGTQYQFLMSNGTSAPAFQFITSSAATPLLDESEGQGGQTTALSTTGWRFFLIQIARGTGGVNHIATAIVNLSDSEEYGTTSRTRYITWNEGGLTVNGNLAIVNSSGFRITNNLGSGTTFFKIYGIR